MFENKYKFKCSALCLRQVQKCKRNLVELRENKPLKGNFLLDLDFQKSYHRDNWFVVASSSVFLHL